MSIWSAIKEWCERPATPQAVAWIARDQVEPTYSEVVARSDQTYVRVWLVEMSLGQARAWFKDYQPTVQSLTRLQFGDRTVELPRLSAADKARYAQGKSVLMNYRLLDLVPFRGGSIELEAGLIAIPGDDTLANGIRALANVASLFAAPLAGAIAAATKVKESADLLVGSGAKVALAYHNTFTAEPGDNQLRCGYLAVVQADPASIAHLVPVVRHGELRLSDGKALYPVGHDYMLLRFELLSQRDDLRAFSELEKLRADAIRAFVQEGDAAGDRAYRAALGAILIHPELINADRRVLAAELKADCDPLRGGGGHRATPLPTRTWAEFIDELPRGQDHRPIELAELL